MHVIDTTHNGRIIGEAETEEDAVEILQGHFADYPIIGAKQARCLLADLAARPHGGAVLGWIPVTEPADVIAAVGRALFGDHGWQAKLARALDVNENTVGRWLTDRTPLPASHGVFATLSEHLRRLGALADKLDQWRDGMRDQTPQ